MYFTSPFSLIIYSSSAIPCQFPDLRISVVKDVQHVVFHQFLLEGSMFRKIAHYRIVQMQEAQLVNQIRIH